MPLGRRRMGRVPTSGYDVFSGTNGVTIIRAIAANQVVASYLTSLTAQQLIDRIAQEHFVDSNNYRCAAHNSIAGEEGV